MRSQRCIYVPAAEVLRLCQRTLCLVGNASERISRERRSKILGAIDPAWDKYGSDCYPKAWKTLFGEDLKSALVDKVEKDTALSKAVAMTRKGKNPTRTSSTFYFRRDRQHTSQFFPRGPPAAYGSRQGRNQYHTTSGHVFGRGGVPASGRRQPSSQPQPKASIPRATPANGSLSNLETPTGEIMAMIKTLLQSPLIPAQVSFDLGSVEREATRPVGGKLCYFVHNWRQVTNDPWVLGTIQGYKLQFLTTPQSTPFPLLSDSTKTLCRF